jgi:hypothetical protein
MMSGKLGRAECPLKLRDKEEQTFSDGFIYRCGIFAKLNSAAGGVIQEAASLRYTLDTGTKFEESESVEAKIFIRYVAPEDWAWTRDPQ